MALTFTFTKTTTSDSMYSACVDSPVKMVRSIRETTDLTHVLPVKKMQGLVPIFNSS